VSGLPQLREKMGKVEKRGDNHARGKMQKPFGPRGGKVRSKEKPGGRKKMAFLCRRGEKD